MIVESPSPTHSTEQLQENVDALVDHLNKLPDKEKLEVLSKFKKWLKLQDVEFIPNLVQSHSVRLYFHCLTVESLRALHQLVVSGELKSLVERFFNELLSEVSSGKESVRVKMVYLINYCSCEQHFAKREYDIQLIQIIQITINNNLMALSNNFQLIQ